MAGVKIHDRLRSAGQRPVPVRATVLGLPTALLVTVRLPVTGPTAVGRKLTDRLQDLPAASVAGATGQLPRVAVNGPVVVTGLVAAKSSAPGPLFCTLMFCVRVVPRAAD